MNFLALTIEQMVAVTADWLSRQRGLLAKVSYTACYLEDMDVAHQHLVTFLPKPLLIPAEVQALLDRGVALDNRYDRLYRGCNRTLEAQEYLAEAEGEAAQWSAAQSYYFPRGDGGTALTFQEESGAALILHDKLTANGSPAEEYRTLVKQVSATKDKTLLEMLQTLVSVGQELGEVDTAKTKALKELEEANRSSTGDNARRLQFEWIEIAKLLVGGMERGLKKGLLTQAEYDTLTDPLEKAHAAAQKRIAAKQKAESKSKPYESNTVATD